MHAIIKSIVLITMMVTVGLAATVPVLSHDCYASCNSALQKQTKCVNSAGDSLNQCLCGSDTTEQSGKYTNSTVSSFKDSSTKFVDDLNACIKCGQAAWFFYGPILKMGADQCNVEFSASKRSEDTGMELYDALDLNKHPSNTIPTPGVVAAGIAR